jgi:hypothetical protein
VGACSGVIFLNILSNYFSNGGVDINNIAFAASGGLAASTYGFRKNINRIDSFFESNSFGEFRRYILKDKYKEQLEKMLSNHERFIWNL